MGLSVGIVGLPNAGKSTLFNALTKQAVPAENFPFCTINPSVGVVIVPDERLEQLSRLASSQKVTPTTVTFTDIAGLVRGAADGEGLGNRFLSHIREVDAIAHVVRVFADGAITHVDGTVDAYRDIDTIHTELLLADLQTIERRLGQLQKEVKRGTKAAEKEEILLKKIHTTVATGTTLLYETLTEHELEEVRHLHLLTAKPLFFVINATTKNDTAAEGVIAYAKEHGIPWTIVTAEKSIAQTSDAVTLQEDDIQVIIQTAYRTLRLITFFTVGEKETRAWTVTEGSTAKEAGRAIHSDFEEKFIRAEVIAYQDAVALTSLAQAKQVGVFRIEGKGYVVKDGDCITFRI